MHNSTSKKFVKDYIEFYITNVCNFNCDNCNRFNNYYFSGHELWSDHADEYQQWSTKVDFEHISILGGEPTLNSDLSTWVRELRNLWPNAKMSIVTNGSKLKYWHQRGFFDLLANTNTELLISLHNRSRYQEFINEIKSYLIDPKETYVSGVEWKMAYVDVKDPSWPDCENYKDFLNLPEHIKKECIETHKIGYDDFIKNTGILELDDKRGVKVRVTYFENFRSAPIFYTGNNKFSVYDSDPEQAHKVCISKTCTHMMKGKMYKCHNVALLPEFSKQFDVHLTDDQKKSLSSYQPLAAGDGTLTMSAFLEELPNTIPQCNLCPSETEHFFLQSTTDKLKIKKKIFDIKLIN